MAMDEALVPPTPCEKKRTRSMLQSKTRKSQAVDVEIPKASARPFANCLQPASELQDNIENSMYCHSLGSGSSMVLTGKSH
jgi:hypothetical protein